MELQVMPSNVFNCASVTRTRVSPLAAVRSDHCSSHCCCSSPPPCVPCCRYCRCCCHCCSAAHSTQLRQPSRGTRHNENSYATADTDAHAHPPPPPRHAARARQSVGRLIDAQACGIRWRETRTRGRRRCTTSTAQWKLIHAAIVRSGRLRVCVRVRRCVSGRCGS